MTDQDSPHAMRFPTADCPGQARLAKPSLTMATRDVVAISDPVNSRPASSGIPISWK